MDSQMSHNKGIEVLEGLNSKLESLLNLVKDSTSSMKDIVMEKLVLDLEMISESMDGFSANVQQALDGYEVSEVVDDDK